MRNRSLIFSSFLSFLKPIKSLNSYSFSKVNQFQSRFNFSIKKNFYSTINEDTNNSKFNLWETSEKILLTSEPLGKVNQSFHVHKIWNSSNEEQKKQFLELRPNILTPEYPARPKEPACISSLFIPSHKEAGVSLEIYLLHSLAHIELNAIDMCWDVILRFRKEILPIQFYTDFIKIATDESRHFKSLSERLVELGSRYGALVSHGALWQNAVKTKDDLKARIAMMQLVQEARALDSHERLTNKLREDKVSRNLVDLICKEEEDHVRRGMNWFMYLCEKEKLDPISTFHSIFKQHANSPLPPPFNHISRGKAGFTKDWYVPLARKSVRSQES